MVFEALLAINLISKYHDGEAFWDIYSVVAIIVECDMGVNEFLKFKDERGA